MSVRSPSTAPRVPTVARNGALTLPGNASNPAPRPANPFGPPGSAGRWLTALVAGLLLFALFSAVQAAPSPNISLNLDQCRNGGWNDPAIDPCQWVNGNLNGNQAHYVEGESIAYRATFAGVVPSTEYTVRIGWDITKDGKHAIDYLTSYDRIAESVNPCQGVSPCVFGGAFPIPQPAGSPQPQGSFNALDAAERFLSAYGATILSASYASQGPLSGSSESTMDITFRATASTAVLAWGGHIASQADWGAGNSAVDISGSPYHMRLKSFSAGNVGNQDRSLQDARAPVAEPQGGSLTVVKEVVNDDGGSASAADFSLHVLSGGQDVAGSPAAGDAFGRSYVGLPAGSYKVTEDAAPGYSLTYSGDCDADGDVLLADEDILTCVLTNDDEPSFLTVVKQFVNDDGGDASLADVGLYIDGTLVPSGQATAVLPGTHQVSEVGPAGYAAFFAGDCDENGTVSVAQGESKVCLLTDDDIAPILTVRKVVVNDHGGDATAASFTLRVDGSSVGNGVPAAYAAGLHQVSEDAAPGYSGSIGGDCAADGSILLAPGDEKECTITNDDVQPLLTVTKVVVNDDGGSFEASEAELFIDGFSAPHGEPVGLFAGSHQVSESPVPGYAASFGGDCDANGTVHLLPGDAKSCTVTNDDIRPRLTVTKLVVNDDGGVAVAGDFGLRVDGQAVASGLEAGYDAGPHQVSEDGAGGYALTAFGGDCAEDGSVSLAPGDVKACTVTNDDIQPRLTVRKVVVNDHGGTAQASDFALHVGGSSVANGAETGFDAGTYQVWEDGLPGYAASFSGDCDADGNVSLAIGDVQSCTITNDDIQPRLTVTKVVINDDGGQASVDDFPLSIDGEPVASGSETGLMAGLHTVSELGSPGYAASFSGDCDDQGQVSLLPGESKSCTITNDDIRPLLTVVKVVVNDNGGTATVADALLFVGSTQVASGEQNGFDAGSYVVTEQGPFGYAPSLAGDCAPDGSLLLEPGDVKVCVFTNDDIQPLLTITKQVVNDNGGTASVSDFQLWVGDQLVLSGQQEGFDAGIYPVSESGPAGYAGSISGDCSEDWAVSLSVGEAKACLIVNDDIQPRLTVTKVVINDDGGEASVGSFGLFVGNASVTSGAEMGFDAGSYLVSESGPAGYAASFSGDCDPDGRVSLAIGEAKSCTITNDDIAPILTVIKLVVNDDGGDASVADFPLWVGDHQVASGAPEAFFAGTYAVSETGLFGYAGSIGGDCDANGTVSLAVGEVKSCTITNDDIAPLLTVTKVVVNDNGGNASVADFPLWVGGLPASSGVQAAYMAGSYLVSETGLFGYAGSIGGDCAEDGSIALHVGEAKSCTITNDDIQPRLTVTKLVINDNGGSAQPGDFPLWVGGSSVASGVEAGFDAGTYAVSETGLFGYAGSIGGDCDANGTVSLAVGEVKSCTITNDDIQPRLTVTKLVVNDDGGNASASDYALTVGGSSVLSGQEAGFDAGSYLVSESGPAGYAASFAGDCDAGGNVSLAVGESKSCILTNDDIAPILTVVKVVVNDSGGAALVSDFALSVGSEPVASGAPEAFDTGSYQVSESGPAGYAASFSGDCDSDGNVTLALAEEKTCVLTNDDIPARLRVVKVVILDDGGLAAPGDFAIHVDATDADPADFAGAASPGVLVTLDAGAYRVTEAFNPEYRASYSSGCAGLLGLDQEATCTITNDDLSLASRTQGFWSTHTKFTQGVFADLGGTMSVGATGHLRAVDTDGKLFGAWYADISKMTNGAARTPLDQARMQLLQQLVTAKLNCAAFGCAMADWIDIQEADQAYAGSDRAAILAAAAEMDAFNNGNDGMPLPSSLGKLGGASPKTSQNLANRAYWNSP